MSYQGKPDFYKYHQRFEQGSDFIEWFLDVSPKTNKVAELYFESNLQEKYLEQAELICEFVRVKPLGDIPSVADLNTNGLWPVSLMTYRLFIEEIIGQTIPYHVQKSEEAGDLICRCFGVYKQEVLQFLINESEHEPDLSSLGSGLRAGIGCGNCHQDLMSLLATFGHHPKKEVKAMEQRLPEVWERLDSQNLASACHDLLQVIKLKNQGINKLGVFGVKPGHILIKYDGSLKESDIEDFIRSAFEREFGQGLEFSLR